MVILLGIAGLLALAAAVVPKLVHQRPFSMPLVMLVAGLGVGLLPLPSPYGGTWGDIGPHLSGVEQFTRLGMLVTLAGAGLSIDRLPGWRRWQSTWRMLAIAMPVTMIAMAAIGHWWLALAPASALLLGALLAPTDPVLAGDVGVPTPDAHPELAGNNEVRFTLTTEAGLNDGLAMPFVLLAVALAAPAPRLSVGWVLTGLVLPVVVGLLIGLATGWLLGFAMFRTPSRELRLADYTDGLVLLAIAFLPYAVSELAHGNGFVAVFTAAVVVRTYERSHEYHTVLHDFGTQLERLFVSIALLGLGVALGDGLLRGLRPAEVLAATVLVLVVRPLAGLLSLAGAPARGGGRLAIAFFGVRGVGTLFYLAFAFGHAPFANADTVWRTAALAVAISVLVHGIAADPVMRWVENRDLHQPRPAKSGPD